MNTSDTYTPISKQQQAYINLVLNKAKSTLERCLALANSNCPPVIAEEILFFGCDDKIVSETAKAILEFECIPIAFERILNECLLSPSEEPADIRLKLKVIRSTATPTYSLQSVASMTDHPILRTAIERELAVRFAAEQNESEYPEEEEPF
jgi:hypothetical protein